jgi:hypothetical protein
LLAGRVAPSGTCRKKAALFTALETNFKIAALVPEDLQACQMSGAFSLGAKRAPPFRPLKKVRPNDGFNASFCSISFYSAARKQAFERRSAQPYLQDSRDRDHMTWSRFCCPNFLVITL